MVTGVALFAPLTVLTAGPVGAAGGTSCTGQSGTVTISPGITTTKQTEHFTSTETITHCTGGGVSSGSIKSTFTVKNESCTTAAKLGVKTGPFPGTITWNTKKTSTFSETTVTGPTVVEATLTGNVLSGLFASGKISNVLGYTYGKGTSCTTGIKKITIVAVKGKPFDIS